MRSNVSSKYSQMKLVITKVLKWLGDVSLNMPEFLTYIANLNSINLSSIMVICKTNIWNAWKFKLGLWSCKGSNCSLLIYSSSSKIPAKKHHSVLLESGCKLVWSSNHVHSYGLALQFGKMVLIGWNVV